MYRSTLCPINQRAVKKTQAAWSTPRLITLCVVINANHGYFQSQSGWMAKFDYALAALSGYSVTRVTPGLSGHSDTSQKACQGKIWSENQLFYPPLSRSEIDPSREPHRMCATPVRNDYALITLSLCVATPPLVNQNRLINSIKTVHWWWFTQPPFLWN